MPKASAWTTSPRRRSMPIRPGRRARRTTTRCRRWATPTPGSTARTGSSGRSCRRSSRRSTAATWRRPRPGLELKEIAEFFQGREIDGKTVYGAAIFTQRGAEGITMGATWRALPFGFKYETEPGTYQMEGAVNSPEAVEGLEFYKALYECCTRAGLHRTAYMQESLDAFKSGQVAMAMNWFAFFPGLYKDENVGGDKIGFFVNPSEKVAASTLGGQGISVVSYSEKQDAAKEYIKWFADPEVQKKWWSLGGYSAHNAVLNDPSLQGQPAVRGGLPGGDGAGAGLLAGAGLRGAAARDAEAAARLRGGRPGHRPGGARRPGRRTGPRSSRTRARSSTEPRLTAAPGAPAPGAPERPPRQGPAMAEAPALDRAAEHAARATPPALARRVRGPERPGDRLAVHRADDRCCCWRSTSSR